MEIVTPVEVWTGISTNLRTLARFRPVGRGTFLCAAKEKYPKERRPGGLPAARVPCASRQNRRSPNSRSRWRSIRSDMASLAPVFPAMLGCANGVWAITLDPVGRAEYRSRSGEKARILSEAALIRAAELCAPPEWRGTQGIGVADAGSGCPSLWVLSLGHARESTSPDRAKPGQNQKISPNHRL